MNQTTGLRERILQLTAGMEHGVISDLPEDVRGLLQDCGLEPGRARAPKPSRMFFVPEGVRYLDGLQLAALTRAVDDWARQGRNAGILFSRQRVRMIYLMLRHSGAKVGEVLCLDDTRDLDFDACEVIIRSHAGNQPGNQADSQEARQADSERRVMLPKTFVAELRGFLDQPEARAMRGQVFRMDQGFVRRKLAEQADRVPFPRELLNPTVLRHSRAVELLRQGVPLPVVQGLLGHASVVLTSGYYAFSDHDSRRILHHHIQKAGAVKTSARNSFQGVVSAVRSGKMLTGVTLTTKSGLEVASVITNQSVANLGIRKGKLVTAIIKAPFVMASHEAEPCFPGPLNTFQATVTMAQCDDEYLQVTGALDDGTTMCSLMPCAPQSATPLCVGGTVWFSFRPLSVILVAE